MHRRHFIAASTATAVSFAFAGQVSQARQATPSAAGLPRLDIELTDSGFTLPETINAGRYEFSAVNTGTMTLSHFGLGKFPDEVTEADIEEFYATGGEGPAAFTWEDIGFVGAPDWPQPEGPTVTGVIDLQPGRYIIFKPLADEEPVRFAVEGTFAAVEEPVADLTVTLHEMTISLPESAFTSEPMRWKIENAGAMHHEVAVLPIPTEMTGDDFMAMMMMPEDATPLPGTPELEYQPVAAIGILAAGNTSWLDVQLEPGHYLAACMLPFGTGYPHAMDGMYVIFDVA